MHFFFQWMNGLLAKLTMECYNQVLLSCCLKILPQLRNLHCGNFRFNHTIRKTIFHWTDPWKIHLTLFFNTQFHGTKTLVRDALYMHSSVKAKIYSYELFENILFLFWLELISQTVTATYSNFSLPFCKSSYRSSWRQVLCKKRCF